MFTTLRNAWKIDDLRKKVLFTLLILVVYRLGVNLPVPFINVDIVSAFMQLQSGTIFGFADLMNGGGLSKASVFALGVQPYINATIILQLLGVAIPALERMQKEGPDGQKRFARIGRYVGGGLAVALGFGYYWVMRAQGALKYGAGASLFPQIFTAIIIILSFTAGALLVMWMGEQIDQKGIGNGISLLIFAGIVSRVGSVFESFKSFWGSAMGGETKYFVWMPIIVILALASVVFVIILNAAERRIPVQYAKKVVGRKMYGGQSSHIPIKVNMSGVMPIIFASSFTSIPATILAFFPAIQNGNHPVWASILNAMSSSGWIYAVVYTLLIIAFNYFYVAITYNPIEMANNLKKNNGAIPGIRPGKPTSDFIARTISKVTLIGALFLVVVAVSPILITKVSGMNISLGGTSLLIVVGVALDTTRSMESFMTMRHHKGFLE
ncbi:preprotein translocase subunit SecY [Ruminococcaceae bacterium OttesenSCG-928-A16]|nr:preprotein translocase subunit SecY [Ruminococcaceae bacterium OttesenSCG-928-A16]